VNPRFSPEKQALDALNNYIPLDRYSSSAYRKDRHHIFPRALMTGIGTSASLYNSICNICLLTAEENQVIGSRRPHLYLGEVRDSGTYFKRKMERHLLPVHVGNGVWVRNIKQGFNRFLKERMEMVCRALEEEAGIPLFPRHL
jgi:hypothetical protein